MKTIFSNKQLGHRDHHELYNGELVPGFETHARSDFILSSIQRAGLGQVVEPEIHDLETARQIHAPDYLEFLSKAWDMWERDGRSGTALPYAWPSRGLRGRVRPTSLDGLLGYYSFDASTGFVRGTWEAIKASHDTVLTGADVVSASNLAAFALCRPPGHHAGPDFAGGYCFINNTAVAAQRFRNSGAERVTVLDIDYHHGNGTQEIFYERDDVQVVNLHADPSYEYPFYIGAAEEKGAGPGLGFNLNYPMPAGTEWSAWSQTLAHALKEVRSFSPDRLVVSLGVDTFEGDPISRFKLRKEHFHQAGALIAQLGLPTLFVMEGGYAVEDVGENVLAVLQGFENA
jgi:acetoin utilization deacetylase AcuC-like enzyme